MYVRMYVTEKLRTYHDQITGVMNRNTMVPHLRNVKFFMSPTVYMFRTDAEPTRLRNRVPVTSLNTQLHNRPSGCATWIYTYPVA